MRNLLLGWLLGIACAVSLMVVYEGWYEYRIVEPGAALVRMVNEHGWQIAHPTEPYIKRPRIRF